MNIADRLRTFRATREISQSELGAQIGVRRETIAGYEAGTSVPRVDALIEIAEVLGVSIHDFFDEDPIGRLKDDPLTERLLAYWFKMTDAQQFRLLAYAAGIAELTERSASAAEGDQENLAPDN